MKKLLSAILAVAMVLSGFCMPAIAAESVSVTVPTVDTAKTILPGYTGTKSGVTYTDTYNGCILMTVTGTTQTAYSAFLNALESGGYTRVLRGHKVLDTVQADGNYCNIASIYTKGTDYLVNTLWIPSTAEVKVTLEPLNGLDMNVFKSTQLKTSENPPLIIQIGLDGVVDPYEKDGVIITDANNTHGGMSYAFRTYDGRFVVYDGGGDGETMNANYAARIYNTLTKYNKRSDGIVIAAWVLTHPHTDHMGGFMAFTKYYLGNSEYDVTLERVICNLPNLETQTFTETGRTQSLASGRIDDYNQRLTELKEQGVQVYKAHPGQKYYFDNVTVEILFTFDLLSPRLPDYCFTGTDAYAKMKTKRLISNQQAITGEAGRDTDFTNTFSIISQVTLKVDADTSFKAMMTGDASCFGIEAVNRLYGPHMKSDFLQVPHHGLPQLNQGSSASSDPHYHELQVDLFFGDNTTQAQLDKMYPNANSTTTVQSYVKAYKSYTSSGYGYVKAKYILIPTDLLHSSTYIDGEPGDDNWDAADYTDETFTDTADPVDEYVNIAEGDSRRSSWNPVLHLQEEAEDNGGYVRVARNLVNTFILKANGTVERQQTKATITQDMETPATTDPAGNILIYDADDLKAIDSDATASYKLARDIYFTEARNFALCYSSAFTGTFDGNGYTIYVSEPATWSGTPAFLFGTLGNGAKVKNLTIDGFTATVNLTTGKNCGILAMEATGTVTVDNVHIVNASITDQTGTTAAGANINANIGGFIGSMKTGASNVTVTNSSFEGTIGTDADRTTGSAGGFFGRIGASTASATVATLENCEVRGSISHVVNVGGFAGSVNVTEAGSCTMTGCSNYATVTCGTGPAGGLVGTLSSSAAAASANHVWIGCQNNGAVSAPVAGGAIGSSLKSATLRVTSFCNNGAISQRGSSAGQVGAVIGRVGSNVSQTPRATLNKIVNAGSLRAQAAASKIGIYCGSFIGTANATLSISNGVNLFATATALPAVGDSNPGYSSVNLTDCSDCAFEVLNGARVRLSSTVGDSGLRFDIALDADILAALEGAGFSVRIGSMAAKADTVTGAFTKEALDAASVRYSDMNTTVENAHLRYLISKTDETVYGYTAALVNIKNYSTSYACVGYLAISTADGLSTRVYTDYDAVKNARSIATVAASALEDKQYTYSDEQTEILNTFAGN